MSKIVLINGSPRKYGAVRKLLTIASKGVKDAGGEPVIIDLYDYNIKECMGCVSDDQRICRFPCIIDDDDFNRIGRIILDSQGLIIGSPIYWYGVSGKLKNLIDRMTSMENMIVHTGRSLLDGKVAGFIVSGNDSGSIMAIAYLMTVFNSMGIHIPPWALAYHHTPVDVLSDEQAVMDSYNVGYIVTKASLVLSNMGEWYKVIDKKYMDALREEAEREAEKYINQREKRYKYYKEKHVTT